MGNRKPTQFLRHLRGLDDSQTPESMLRTLWSGRLPVDVQPILAAHKEMPLDRLAELADNIFDLTRKCPVIAETSSGTETLIQQFTTVLGALTTKIASLRAEVSGNRGRGNNRSSLHPRDRSRSHNRPHSNGVCYYHTKFGDNARRCSKPDKACSFSEKNGTASR